MRTTGNSHEFYTEHGLREYVASMTQNKTPLGEIIDFSDTVDGHSSRNRHGVVQ
jgi:DNA gyrase/topoisomerase IV subunit B